MSDRPELDDELLAAEYVIGLLGPEETALVEARLRRDRAFATLVAAWSDRLAPAALALPEQEPPAALWRRIDAAISPAAPLPRPAPPVTPRQPRPVPSRAGGAARWKVASAAGFALAAALAVYIAATPHPEPPREAGRYVAYLQTGADTAGWLVSVDTVRRKVELRPLSALPPPAPGRSYELWMVSGSDRPRSLGVIDASGAALPLAGHPGDSATLAVSVEPAGGSPTGAPTGPVIYQGNLLPLGE